MILKNKVCIITGAASGIGKATAVSFAREGATLILADISESVFEVTDIIGKVGGEATAKIIDISDENSVSDLLKMTTAKLGRLDCAVNSAGIAGSLSVPTHEYLTEEWSRQIAVNLTGAWYFLKFSLREMLQSGGGSIVLVSSAAGLRGQPNNSPYAASKHGVIGMTKTAALEYATQNIRVNCVCPTAIETPMIMQGRRQLSRDPQALQNAKNYQAMERLGQPEEVAEVNLWLCSERASFITGSAIPVDGGALVR